MADAIAWLQALLAPHGLIAAGLVIGTLAKYGLTLSEGGRLTRTGMLADACLLGMLGALAVQMANWLSLTGNSRLLAGAVAAMSSGRLVRLVRDTFLARAEREAAKALDLPPDTVAELGPPFAKSGPVVKVRPSPEPVPPTRRELRQAFRLPTDTDPVADHLLKKLNGDDL